MPKVTTRLGYVFHSDEDVEVNKMIEVPLPPEVEDPVTIPDKTLRYLSQMYGQQKEWNQKVLEEFAAHEGLERFPDFILKLEKTQLEEFLTKMFGVSAVGVRHYSTSASDLPEFRFRCMHESLARELQYLWWRLGIRSRVYKNPQIGWVWESSGNEAYVRMRPYMLASKNPKIKKKMKELDRLVPFKFREGIQPMRDKVIKVETDGE